MEDEIIMGVSDAPVSIEPEVVVDAACGCEGEGCKCGKEGCDCKDDACVCKDGKCECANGIADFMGTILDSVNIVWKLHLQETKYSAHIALNEYYDEAPEIIDGIVELYQSKYGIVKGYANRVDSVGKTPSQYLKDLRDYINDKKATIFEENFSDMFSAIDNLLQLIGSTIYKLDCLKESNIKSFDAFVYEKKMNESRRNFEVDNDESFREAIAENADELLNAGDPKLGLIVDFVNGVVDCGKSMNAQEETEFFIPYEQVVIDGAVDYDLVAKLAREMASRQ